MPPGTLGDMRTTVTVARFERCGETGCSSRALTLRFPRLREGVGDGASGGGGADAVVDSDTHAEADADAGVDAGALTAQTAAAAWIGDGASGGGGADAVVDSDTHAEADADAGVDAGALTAQTAAAAWTSSRRVLNESMGIQHLSSKAFLLSRTPRLSLGDVPNMCASCVYGSIAPARGLSTCVLQT